MLDFVDIISELYILYISQHYSHSSDDGNLLPDIVSMLGMIQNHPKRFEK